jgi:hypothetical protein
LHNFDRKRVLLTNTSFSCWVESQVVTRDLALIVLEAGAIGVFVLLDEGA